MVVLLTAGGKPFEENDLRMFRVIEFFPGKEGYLDHLMANSISIQRRIIPNATSMEIVILE